MRRRQPPRRLPPRWRQLPSRRGALLQEWWSQRTHRTLWRLAKPRGAATVSTQGFGASSPAHSYPSRLQAELRERLPGRDIVVLHRGVGVFPRFAIMRHWSQERAIPFAQFISPDGLHMNDWSHACAARLLADAIVEAANRSVTLPTIAAMPRPRRGGAT